MSDSGNIGVIAGGGQFPKLFVDAAQKSGKRSVVIAFRGETTDEVIAAADEICLVKLGQVGKVIKFFKKHNVTEAHN